MKQALIVFPNQIFKQLPDRNFDTIVLVEDGRFFLDFNFHKKKLIYHRACLQYYKDFLKRKELSVSYFDHQTLKTKCLSECLRKEKITNAVIYDPTDHKLLKKLRDEFKSKNIILEILESPLFICSEKYLSVFFENKSHYSMNSFYIAQRKKYNILIDDGKPIGKKWSLDNQNREHLNSKIEIPALPKIKTNRYIKEATTYIEKNFPKNPGKTANFIFPVTHRDAENWLKTFFEQRFDLFGPYEDAISKSENFLYHSLLSAPLNVGLLKPLDIVNAAIKFAQNNKIRLNSLEGFIRQIIGWREFMRAVYMLKGKEQRQSNFWNFTNNLPKSFYNGTTNIEPIDLMIKRVSQNAYLHHIERLMIVGNFMLLCEINPQKVYRWFMELFIDAYDWVMTPNVFGMSQYSHGNTITTKPYISSSNYILKMSDFEKGSWCNIWDSLFWNFINKHKRVFAENPRMKIMAIQAERMSPEKMKQHLIIAEAFLKKLYQN